jgi:hypothetical protein
MFFWYLFDFCFTFFLKNYFPFHLFVDKQTFLAISFVDLFSPSLMQANRYENVLKITMICCVFFSMVSAKIYQSGNACNTSSDCSGTTPICITGVCTACSSDVECDSKNISTPVCESGGDCAPCINSLECDVDPLRY